MQVFRTEADFPEQIQILGVGLLKPRGENALPVEDAAARGMSELSKKDKDGKLVLNDQGGPIPLTGKELTAAAKAWADRIHGLEVSTLKEAEISKMKTMGEMRMEFSAEDTLAAAEWYASQTNPVITRVEGGEVVSAEHADAQEAAEAQGTALSTPGDDEGGEG